MSLSTTCSQPLSSSTGALAPSKSSSLSSNHPSLSSLSPKFAHVQYFATVSPYPSIPRTYLSQYLTKTSDPVLSSRLLQQPPSNQNLGLPTSIVFKLWILSSPRFPSVCSPSPSSTCPLVRCWHRSVSSTSSPTDEFFLSTLLFNDSNLHFPLSVYQPNLDGRSSA